ncbi:MAG: hypothetical protein QY325_01755 [Flavobacteriales bacterium]|nr:MAG: hypothetical protein QY325_01755 [Flavobacteriales bacterium]
MENAGQAGGAPQGQVAGFGGFMGLEPWGEPGPLPYPEALLLSSGRACLALILDLERPRRVHVPFYACDTLLHPMQERGIELVHYCIDEQFLPISEPRPAGDELTILVDYFGIRTLAVHQLASRLGPRAVIDSTHAYFSGAPPAGHYGFNSARKFRGVPDGAFLFTPRPVRVELAPNQDVHGDHLILRAMGSGPSVRESYGRNEQHISTRIEQASRLSHELLLRLDHNSARDRRLENFWAAHVVLGPRNRLRLDLAGLSSPLNYPLLLDQPVDLRRIHEAGIFAARYWPEIPQRPGIERFPEALDLTERLIAFPIDQRYSPEQIRERAWQLNRLA